MAASLRFSTLILIPSLIFLSLNLDAAIFKGRIVDVKNGEALPGATVSIVGGYRGVAAAGDGSFSINRLMPGNYQFEISFIGYTPITVNISISTVPLR